MKKRVRQKVRVVAFLLLAGFVLAGCARHRAGGTLSVLSPDFFGLGEDLAIQLAVNLRPQAPKGQRLIVATFVDLDNLEQTSRFGRTLPEALANRLFRHGFRVLELRKADEMLIEDGRGELVLTRNAAHLVKEVAADGILCGTYSLTPQTVIVNVRLLDAASQEVLSVADMEIQRTRAINGLLYGAGTRHSRDGARIQLSAYERGEE